VPVAAAAAVDADVPPSLQLSLSMIGALGRAMASRDESAYRHAERVQEHVVAIAREMCPGDTRTIEAIQAAALLHDVGKLAIPDSLLRKAGPLTPGEHQQVRQHVVLGADILAAIPCTGTLSRIVRHHHESWDGTGYPDGLSGEAIPLGARILAVGDCYDALVSDRPYRPSLPHDAAVGIIVSRRGTRYDPAVVDVFVRLIGKALVMPASARAARPATGGRTAGRT
jgi:putative nucleotidyltransferase with HDIG domain